MKEAGIYIHFPFCKSRCDYCDFNTTAGVDELISKYGTGLQKEIRLSSQKLAKTRTIRSIYLGGGTPSYLPPECIHAVLACIRDCFDTFTDIEISMEANPADITISKVSAWKDSGIKRLSIGMQSAHEKDLKLLSRRHRFVDVVRAVESISSSGITNYNLDLMFGLPKQNLSDWQDSVKQALSLTPTHLSLYALTVEGGTPLSRKIQKREVPAPDEDLAADMYEWVMQFLPQEGFTQYEISNWALRDKEHDHRCQHNLLYWRNADYYGFGSSAHSHFMDKRWSNVTDLHTYIDILDNYPNNHPPAEYPYPWIDAFTQQTELEEISETAMMGLRLVEEGLRDDLFQEKFGKSLFTVYEKQIEELVHLELLEIIESGPGSIRLTERGRLVGNQVFLRFLLD